MNKLLIICGPTATGKTKLGIELAKKFDGEIVSADSRQVYRGMNIGTGKEIKGGKWEMSREVRYGKWVVDGISIWLTDVVEPDYRFNVADYKKCADAVLADIWKRGKLPIVVGGTGFYIKAVTDGIGTINIKPDWELRAKLSNYLIDQLRITLKELDFGRFQGMNESDRQNPRRLIRAIEITLKIKNKKLNIKNADKKSEIDKLFIGLKAANEVLYERIDQRVDERVKNGLEGEIESLLAKGYNWDNSALGTTIAYKEWEKFFDAGVGAQHVAPAKSEIKKQVIQKWKFDEHDYARRQLTWFKKDKRINWFNITKSDWQEEVEKMVESWYIKDSSKFKVQSSKL